MAVLTQGDVVDGVKVTLRSLSKVDFFPFFRSWFKRAKEGLNPPPPDSEGLKTIESQVDELIFRFRSGRGVSVIWERPS